MYFGTSNGLDKFDGDNFINFNKSHGLMDNEILEIYSSPKNNLMFLKPFSSYLAILKKDTIYSFNKVASMLKYKSKVKHTQISFNQNNTAFIYLENKVHLIELNNFIQLSVFNTVKYENCIKYFYLKNILYKLISTKEHKIKLFQLNKTSIKLINEWDGIIDAKIKLNNFKNGINQIFDSNNNLYTFNENTFELKKIITLKSEISALTIDRDSIVWYGKNNGIWWCNLKEKNPKHHQLLKGVVVSNVIEDLNGYIWIATIDNGVYLLKNKDIFTKSFNLENSNLPINRIFSNGNKTILGHVNNDFSVLDSNLNLNHSYFSTVQKYNRTIGVVKLNGNDFLVNEYGIYNIKKKKIVYHENAIKAVIKYNDSTILIASVHGLKKLNLKNGTFNLINTYYTDRVSDFCLLDSTTILFGDLEGLFKINLSTKEVKKIELNSTNKYIRINRIVKQNSNKVFILSANSGVFLYKNETIKNVFTDSKILNSNLTSALFLDDSIAFFGTDNGIIRISYSTNHTILNEFVINQEVGLIFNKINDLALINSNIWAATSKGVSYFKYNTVFKNPSISIKFYRLIINSKKVFTDSFPLILEPNENNFTISFSNFSFREKSGIKYCYKLNKAQSKCYSTNENTIVFADLPHGSYTFTVTAQDSYSKNNKSNVITWNFYIKAKFYETWFFYFLLVILLIVMLFAFFYFRLLSLNKKYKQKQEIEIKISQMELKSLRSQLDPHFIFNALNSIKDFIKRNDTKSSKQYLDDFSYLMRYILDSSRENKSLLANELKYIRTYLNLEAMRFGNRFGFIIELSDDIFPENIAIPSLMLQTFVENCIKHGKVGTLNYAGLIEIYVSIVNEDRILIRVLDNGVGININELNSDTQKNNKIHSSQIQYERIEMFNKTSREKIYFQLIRRSDGSPGAEFKIELPMLFHNYD